MTSSTLIRCRCVNCLESSNDKDQPGRLWKRSSTTYKAHQASIKKTRSLLAGPKESNLTTLQADRTIDAVDGIVADDSHSSLTQIPPAEKTISHLDISHLKQMGNPPRQKQTGSHFQPKWNGMSVESGKYHANFSSYRVFFLIQVVFHGNAGQYNMNYYDQFKKFDPLTTAMNLVMVCLYLFEHIGMAVATLCLHVNNSVPSSSNHTAGLFPKVGAKLAQVASAMNLYLNKQRLAKMKKITMQIDTSQQSLSPNALGLMSKKRSTSSQQEASQAEEDESDTFEQELKDFDSDNGDSDDDDSEFQGSECSGDQISTESNSECSNTLYPTKDNLSFAFGKMALEYNTVLDADQETHGNESKPHHFTGFSGEVTRDEEEEEELSDYEEVDEEYNHIFNEKKHLDTLREVIGQVLLPSWIGRVPKTVGSSKGGKLKADEWVILYEIMIIPAFILFFNRKGDNSPITDHKIVRNALHLISILKIVRRIEVQSRDLEALKHHIKSYRHGLSELFTALSVTPNLHMLLHIPQVVRVFGPAPYWTAWSFEATNGSLAKIPTNNHDSSREYTILNKWTMAQNMRCVLPDLCRQLPKQTAANVSKFISPKCTDGSPSAYLREGKCGPPNLKYNPKKNETLDYDTHLLLLSRMKEIYGDEAVLSTDIYKKSQHKEDAIVISRWVNQLPSHIWFDISRYTTLTAAHQKKHGFNDWPHSGLTVVYNREKKKDVVQLNEIVSHGASWKTPQGCFGIKDPTLLIVNLSKTSCTAA
ncbi:uncharacterized protein MELLADRAFT_102220 [Melampsora larici-populina 98AG31]|uniref:Uncharacterized protein n=1 Tax=Melampsora larici-populina (strain 98AG31 / pathotype 3-4-7) TaxID=747676 RepID=F4R7K6_MELLP|nr:uncharacterized protein MELLADRAFT_102220 [Melampsora larici-populina 98AG31]EGG11330.1 hypothetical protein MELLADRAFT_102220 [Melampsora larici-populina 98AG31]